MAPVPAGTVQGALRPASTSFLHPSMSREGSAVPAAPSSLPEVSCPGTQPRGTLCPTSLTTGSLTDARTRVSCVGDGL